MAATNILLVDDEPNVLRALSRSLRDQPYRIYTARSAEEALPIIKAHPVAVVVSDEQMDGRSGTELFAWMAKHCPEVVRIVLTGRSSPETTMRAINDAKVFRYFAKPCHPVELAMAIRDGIDLNSALTGRSFDAALAS
ncbi:MAG: response regulator [Planctomycetota bacterium]